MRLPSNLRMKLARDFACVKTQGASQAGKYLVLGALRVEALEEFQFGLITGGRLGNAVVRNRIRRLLREIIRAHRAEVLPGWQMVIIARWRAPQATLQELENDWLRLARRMSLLKPKTSAPPRSPAP
ncbi:ribonuclease P protein component [Prosthecobacter vanneervenii]|uniref:Ribonuclease P protein component n=1 Tax=Prosthecobacter vanneervenii TaxID=48466 RepID=A0A7W8DM29_9BACT|nr:ribonuclease P protein component [Prosthecobacter vanneervenii]MBB5034461.1 ribonuclease P protein component [Prosthecobacter vanneervenii]